jgi:hypothetical protein
MLVGLLFIFGLMSSVLTVPPPDGKHFSTYFAIKACPNCEIRRLLWLITIKIPVE